MYFYITLHVCAYILRILRECVSKQRYKPVCQDLPGKQEAGAIPGRAPPPVCIIEEGRWGFFCQLSIPKTSSVNLLFYQPQARRCLDLKRGRIHPGILSLPQPSNLTLNRLWKQRPLSLQAFTRDFVCSLICETWSRFSLGIVICVIQ